MEGVVSGIQEKSFAGMLTLVIGTNTQKDFGGAVGGGGGG